MFNTGLKKKRDEGRRALGERLKKIRTLLSDPSLDAKVRVKLEKQAAEIRGYFQTQIQRLNGGPAGR